MEMKTQRNNQTDRQHKLECLLAFLLRMIVFFTGELSIHHSKRPKFHQNRFVAFVFHSTASVALNFFDSIVIKCDVISDVLSEGDVEI
jgi:hypothetical protein